MVVKLHNWPLSTGYECTGCLRVSVQGLLYFKFKVEEMKVKREERKKYVERNLAEKNRWKRRKHVAANLRRKICLNGHIFVHSAQMSHSLLHAYTDVTSSVHVLCVRDYFQYLTVHRLQCCLLTVSAMTRFLG